MFEYATKFLKKSSASVFRWGGVSNVKHASGYFYDISRKLWTRQDEQAEDFEAAIARLGMREEDVERKYKSLLAQSIFYVTLAVLVFFYSCYQVVQSGWLVAFIVLQISCLLFAFAFRSHFWAYQIQQRKLGCRVRDWWQAVKTGEQ